MIETVHIWTENPIYCHKLGKKLIADAAHLTNECGNCIYYSGSAQGQGVENKYYDGSNEPIIQNPNPDILMQRMQSIKSTIVADMVDDRTNRSKKLHLINALKGTKRKYKILDKALQHVALLTFAPDVAIDVNSADQVFLSNIAMLIVNPVNGVTVGMPDYPEAVLNKLTELGYTNKLLN